MSLSDDWKKFRPLNNGDDAAWKPHLYDPSHLPEWNNLQTLIRSGRVRQLHDTILDQLHELAETRLPRKADAGRRDTLARELLGGRQPDRYGRWVFYPWSGRLVHVLPEAEYRELRTSRNVYKITPAEQERLRSLRIGIIGLSVGQATAVTLALEEIGGEYRLADFDQLSLSNMNRLRAGVHSVGVQKVVITAREIFEINPYAHIKPFLKGVDDSNINEFLTGGGNLHLVVEESDDLFMKVFVRERARELRIPVIMETSDRGLLDVERFDLEPHRPLLHGLIGDVRATELRGLPTADKVPFVLEILGYDTISPRFAASLYEIDRTLRTWPQLASGVALGGALASDAARRIALGTLKQSGRYYVDLDQLVGNGQSTSPTRSAPLPDVETPTPIVSIAHPKKHVDEALARTFVQAAILAPSGGNVQPWRFEFDGTHLFVRYESTQSETMLDFERRGSNVALGAAVENIHIAAAHAGFTAQIDAFPESGDPTLVARIGFEQGAANPGVPLEALAARVTNRRFAAPQPITQKQRTAITEAATRAGGHVALITDREALSELGGILGEGDRIRNLNEALGKEAASELRWSNLEVAAGDGLDVRSLDLSATDLAGVRLTSGRNGLALLTDWGLGSTLMEHAQKAFAAASAAALVFVDGTGPRVHFKGGRALQNVWIAAERAGLAVQPYSALLYFFLRNDHGDTSMFSEVERSALRGLQQRFRRLFPIGPNATDVLLLRISHAPRPQVRSLRRPLDEVFRVTSP